MSYGVMFVPSVLHVLTEIFENPNKEFPDKSFKFADVRETLLSYLIFQNALTNNQVECPKELVSRLNWLSKAYFVNEKRKVQLYHLHDSKIIA